MIITLAGANEFALQQELKKLLSNFVAKHGDLAVERVDGREASVDLVAAALNSSSMLADKKLVVLDQPGQEKAFAEQAEQLLSTVPETTEVIIVEPKLDKRLSYYKLLKKNTDYREFTQLDQAGLASWLTVAAKDAGGSISAADARYLVERVGTNQQILAKELEKLSLHIPQITRQTIDLLTDASPQSTVFELLEAAFAGRTRQAAQLYADQRAQKVEPAYIVAMLAWQLHILAVVKTAGQRPTAEIASDAKLNPYVVSKSQSIARSLSLSDLAQHIEELLILDRNIKTSSTNVDEALQDYLLKLAQPTN